MLQSRSIKAFLKAAALFKGPEIVLDKSLQTSAVSLRALAQVSFKIGLLSFGGPAAQIALMHREFVENKKWISEQRFLHALNFCMLLPGPEAQQLATYCGWITGRLWGGLIAGLLFIVPGALAMLLVSIIYVTYGEVSFIQALFYGLKGGVLAIVLQALLRVATKALTTTVARSIALAAFVALFFFKVPFPAVILTSGLLGFLIASRFVHAEVKMPGAKPQASVITSLKTVVTGLVLWGAPAGLAILLLLPDHNLVTIAGFFSTLAVVSFGGAYALLSYMAQVAVETMSWLSAGEMLDGLGLAETTPGPLILVTQFVGFLAGYRDAAPLSPLMGGILAAGMTTWVTFAPSFLFVLTGAPWMERLHGNVKLTATLNAITAAVAGTILNLAVWFALNVLFHDVKEVTYAGLLYVPIPTIASLDGALAAIALVAIALVFAAKRGLGTVLVTSCLLGLGAHYAPILTA